MSDAPIKILAFAGSIKRTSINRRLIGIAARGAAEAGAAVTLLELADYPLPIMNEDLEAAQGLPDNCIALKEIFKSHQGLLIACPEYNGSITPLLKNTIDWVSRPRQGEARLAAFTGKPVSLMSTSNGALGGLRGLVHVRAILGNIGCLVLPEQLAVAQAAGAFDDDGELRDPDRRAAVERLGANAARIAARLREPENL